MILTTGKIAYAQWFSSLVACSTKDAYEQYNNSDKDMPKECQKIDPDQLLYIQHVISKGDHRYIVEVATENSKGLTEYVGAGDISPYIPPNTKLIINDRMTDDYPEISLPELMNQQGQAIGTVLGHTLVKVSSILPWLNPNLGAAYIPITVLSGNLTNKNGYIEVDYLEAITGDDNLSEFLDGQQEIMQ
jgi:hypothetical protein